MDDKYYSTHCASCGKKDPPLTKIYCGECWHPYLIPMIGLVFHNWWKNVVYWLNPIPEFGRGRFPRPKRFKNIIGCPCCAHDL